MMQVVTDPSSAPRQSGKNMIAIASGKGGVGKTWFASTLSHAFARQNQKTLLFDGDLGLANVDVQLGLSPEKDLGGFLAGRYAMDVAVSRYDLGGFDVIAGRSGSGNLATLGTDKLMLLCSRLVEHAAQYDRVILDLGAGVERTVRYLASRASRCLVVTTDEPTSLTDAYAFIKLSKLQNSATEISVVVNMADSTSDGERTYNTLRKACENFLKITPPLAGIIRKDAKVREAIRAQVPLLQRHPDTHAAKDVIDLARKLAT
ncbi:MinD/ParA family protein [Fodinicurvata halophila]